LVCLSVFASVAAVAITAPSDELMKINAASLGDDTINVSWSSLMIHPPGMDSAIVPESAPSLGRSS
jgi:hypothetical protein